MLYLIMRDLSRIKYRGVQSQRDHHHKKDDCEEGGAHHVRDGLWVRDEE